MRAIELVAGDGQRAFADQRGMGVNLARFQQRQQREWLDAGAGIGEPARRDLRMVRRKDVA